MQQTGHEIRTGGAVAEAAAGTGAGEREARVFCFGQTSNCYATSCQLGTVRLRTRQHTAVEETAIA